MAGSTPVTWKVVSVTPEDQFTAQNTRIAGKRVNFTTSSGYAGYVFVPNGVFSDTAAVTRLIEGEVSVVSAVENISGQVTR